jgi:plastocyanin
VTLTRRTIALAVLATTLAACGHAPARADVRVKLLAFGPNPVTVAKGTTITWTDDEPVTHTVTSGTVTGVDPATGLRKGQTADGLFHGRLDARGSTFAHRFDEPGTFGYFCEIHFGMNATVVVTS